MAKNDITIVSLKGGLNNTDDPSAIPADQCTEAFNVEFDKSMLGRRRAGTDAITLSAALDAHDRVPFLFRHIPGTDATAAELWAFGVTGTASSTLDRKTSSWQGAITPTDAITITGTYQYQLQAASLHGKLFLAYKSGQDRMHVWDGTNLRRTGLAEPAAPTAADTAVAGSFSGVRYYRVRYVVVSGSTVLRRSEPSDALTFTPNGAFNGATVTKPASISESETHWELEASTDNNLFYRIARTVVGTTTVTDTTAYTTGYPLVSGAVLSADIGDYSLIHSGRFLVADEDRLLVLGSFEDTALASRVAWTPVGGDITGDGNDERLESDKTPYVNLDGLEGGGITGGASGSFGNVYVFKSERIYKLTRTRDRERAYIANTESKTMGALEGSIVNGIDQTGASAIYFWDANLGPCRIGQWGIQHCGADILETVKTVNLSATQVVCRAVYYPEKRQVHFHIATGSSNIPDTCLVLQTTEMRNTEAGDARRGWSIYNGNRAKAIAVCTFATNIDDNTTRGLRLAPFIGLEGLGLVHRTDTGTTDNSVAFNGSIKTKPFTPVGELHEFEIMAGSLVAKEDDTATLDVKILKNYGQTTPTTVSSVSLAGTGSETVVVKRLNDLSAAELEAAQIQFTDPASPTGRWELIKFQAKLSPGQSAG
jgi:hypothetical protein